MSRKFFREVAVHCAFPTAVQTAAIIHWSWSGVSYGSAGLLEDSVRGVSLAAAKIQVNVPASRVSRGTTSVDPAQQDVRSGPISLLSASTRGAFRHSIECR